MSLYLGLISGPCPAGVNAVRLPIGPAPSGMQARVAVYRGRVS